MIVKAKNDRSVLLRQLNADDYDDLSFYLNLLSYETTRRYGPHRFDKQAIIDIYENSITHFGYIARDIETSKIIAYCVIRKGCLEHDGYRLNSYGLTLNPETDCTFAPSVADNWQSQGIGHQLFRFLLADLKTRRFERVILWGGVQADNLRAVNYYKKNGFRHLGEFQHNGSNYDMILDIRENG
jgi:diamine N-acetyltransferase